MNHDTIEKDQVLERYLMGRLPAASAAEFEEHYLDCADCLEQLELSDAFQSGLRQAVSEDALQAAQRLGVLAWLARAARSPRAGLLAAAALLAVALPVGYLQRQVTTAREQRGSLENQLVEARAPRGNVTILELSPERSAGGEPSTRLRLPQPEAPIVLALGLERPQSGNYRVTLENSEGATLWQADGLIPDYRDALNLSLPSSLLEAGDYGLRVEAPSAEGGTVTAGRFRFRVIASD